MSRPSRNSVVDPPPAPKRKAGGFTLIELLVVIAIISLLVSILLPSLRQAKEQAKTVVCKTDMRAIYTALALYVEDSNGRLMRSEDNRTVGTEEVHIWWPETLTIFTENDFPDDRTNWYAPRSYIEQRDIYLCPSADPAAEFLKAAEPWPWGYGIEQWEYDIYGNYGLNNRITNHSPPSSIKDKSRYYNFWGTNQPSQLFLMAGSFLFSFDHCNDESDFWYEMRHGAKKELLHIMFHDNHIESYLEEEIPISFDAVGCLPWYNEE